MKITKYLALILAAVLALAALTACSSPEKELLGDWTLKSEVLGIVTESTYTFEENGTGAITAVAGIGQAMTYKVEDGTLTITTALLGISNSTVYTFEFTDKNTLALTSGDGEQLELKRVVK